jgi:hypothetical protein
LAALLSILSSLVVGVVLVLAPWMSLFGIELWEANWLLQLWPGARGVLLNAFTRGAVTGIGLVNLTLALRDLHARFTGDAARD